LSNSAKVIARLLTVAATLAGGALLQPANHAIAIASQIDFFM
jgi:hypothetical protein